MGLFSSIFRKSRDDTQASALKHDCTATQWGPMMWGSIHWATVHFPSGCNDKLKERYWSWILGFGYTAPCPKCRHNWRCIIQNLRKHRAWIMHTNQKFACMFFDIHNIWNALTGKSMFPFKMFKTTYQAEFDYVAMFHEVCDDRFSMNLLFNSTDAGSSEGSSHNDSPTKEEPAICVLDGDDICECDIFGNGRHAQGNNNPSPDPFDGAASAAASKNSNQIIVLVAGTVVV